MNTIRAAVVVLIAFAAAVVAYAQAPAKPITPAELAAFACGFGENERTGADGQRRRSEMGCGAAPFNPGAQMAVIDGDPTKPGPFVIRAKFPAGFKVMPHFHPTDESVTVISGTLAAAMGEVGRGGDEDVHRGRLRTDAGEIAALRAGEGGPDRASARDQTRSR